MFPFVLCGYPSYLLIVCKNYWLSLQPLTTYCNTCNRQVTSAAELVNDDIHYIV
jgi:hypothetical protein